jgi:hypothetical protein
MKVMADSELENVLTDLWELPDGTKACVIEHPATPRWELCLVRHGEVQQRHQCSTIAELIAKAMALHAVATAG